MHEGANVHVIKYLTLTASISFSAFQCSLGASIPEAVLKVRLSKLVHTRRFGIFSFCTYLDSELANCKWIIGMSLTNIKPYDWSVIHYN